MAETERRTQTRYRTETEEARQATEAEQATEGEAMTHPTGPAGPGPAGGGGTGPGREVLPTPDEDLAAGRTVFFGSVEEMDAVLADVAPESGRAA